MRILISNDDGINAEGIQVLAQEFSDHEVFVVAPERERSTTGHSLTLHKPLRLRKVAKNQYFVSGGPADCIYLGIHEILKGKKPDLVLSGINRGANLGQDVFYSGTASAAREASNLGIPSVAVSLDLSFHKETKVAHYESAAKMCRKILFQALASFGSSAKKGWEKSALKSWPEKMMLNINVPNLPLKKLKGVRVAKQGQRFYGSQIVKRADARGRDYFWIGGLYEGYRPDPETDCWWVDHGYVAVTPLELDTTYAAIYQQLKNQKGFF